MENLNKKKNGSNKTITIISVVLCVILLPILLINITLIVKSAFHKELVPSIFNVSPMIVDSNNMVNEFASGDLIFVKKTETSNINEGDIIAFYDNNAILTLKVFNKTVDTNGNHTFTVKGEGNNTYIVKDEHIIGAYFYNLKGMGNIAIFLQSPLGMVLCIGLPLIFFFIFDSVIRHRNAKRKASDNISLSEFFKKENEKLKEEIYILKTQSDNNE